MLENLRLLLCRKSRPILQSLSRLQTTPVGSATQVANGGPSATETALPLIPMTEYQARRNRLLRAVQNLPHVSEYQRHIFVLPSAELKYMAFHVPYVFHQDSYFRYLCGFPEPNSALVMSFQKDSEVPHSHLFVQNRTPSQTVWDGPTLGCEGAKAFLTDEVHDVNELESVLESLLKDSDNTAVWFAHASSLNAHLRDLMTSVLEGTPSDSILDPSSVIDLLRLVKSPAELQAMRTAARIGGQAIAETMRFCAKHADNMSEFKLWAKVDFESRMRGSLLAYPPVVGGGNNTNIIHYLKNDQPVRPGDLVLMDAGSQCDGYVSDITRTWPVSGRFTDPQRIVYEIVLRVLDNCISLVNPDTSLNRLYHHMLGELSKEFKAAGVIKKSCRWENDTELGHQICPHHIGHWLGLDVHDTPSVSTTLGFMHGVVFPLEPGAYFPASCRFVEPEFCGIGIRVEDDIAMTASGVEVLTKGCPRAASEIEAWMQPRGE